MIRSTPSRARRNHFFSSNFCVVVGTRIHSFDAHANQIETKRSMFELLLSFDSHSFDVHSSGTRGVCASGRRDRLILVMNRVFCPIWDRRKKCIEKIARWKMGRGKNGTNSTFERNEENSFLKIVHTISSASRVALHSILSNFFSAFVLTQVRLRITSINCHSKTKNTSEKKKTVNISRQCAHTIETFTIAARVTWISINFSRSRRAKTRKLCLRSSISNYSNRFPIEFDGTTSTVNGENFQFFFFQLLLFCVCRLCRLAILSQFHVSRDATFELKLETRSDTKEKKDEERRELEKNGAARPCPPWKTEKLKTK